MHTRETTSETEKAGIREFRENLSTHLEGHRPRAITRHGDTLGLDVPLPKRSTQEALRVLEQFGTEIGAMVEKWGVTEDELIVEFESLPRADHESKVRIQTNKSTAVTMPLWSELLWRQRPEHGDTRGLRYSTRNRPRPARIRSAAPA